MTFAARVTPLARYRRWLAVALVLLLPGAALNAGNVLFSGGSYHPDGTRDLGRLAKNAAGAPGDVIVLGAVTLMAGLIALALARILKRTGGLWLCLIATATGAVAGLGFVALAQASSPDATLHAGDPRAFGPPLLFASAAAALSSLYCLVAPVPIRPGLPRSGSGASTVDHLTTALATVLAVAILGWIGGMAIYSSQHPCNCG